MRRTLVVDDDRDTLNMLSEHLSAEGHSVQTASDSDGALHRVRAWKPQLVLLDVNMPGASGIELIPKIRALTTDDYTAILMVSANSSQEDVMKGLAAGADDYLVKPFHSPELHARVQIMFRFKEIQDQLRRAQHRIEELSSTDELTGLMNMRAAYRRGEEEIVRCRRFKKSVSALLVNIDQFSAINQGFDFLVGSYLIQEVANRVRSCVRSIDIIARVGGDEFFVLLSETDLGGAEFVAERIRDAVQTAPFKSEKQSLRVTVCIGVSMLTPESADQSMRDLFRTTSEALRSAKANGTNRVEIYSFA